MTSIRYLNAFLLSALTFSLLYFGYLFLPKEKKIIKPAPSKVIKIALVTPPKKVVKPVINKVALAPLIKPTVTPILPPKKVVKKRVIKKKIIQKPKPKKIIKKIVKKKRVVKKHKPKKVVKKRIIKRPKKILKKKRVIKKKVMKKHKPKKVIKKKIIKKREVVKKQIVEEYIETYVAPAPVYVAPKPKVTPIKKYVPAPKPVARPISKPIVQPTIIQPTPMVKNSHQNKHFKKAFLRNVRSKILANKTYPRIAKRRHIEGSVKVRFDITKQGELRNIRFVNGKSLFHKSIREALERSFPVSIPPNVQGELPIFDVSVVLHFNIR